MTTNIKSLVQCLDKPEDYKLHEACCSTKAKKESMEAARLHVLNVHFKDVCGVDNRDTVREALHEGSLYMYIDPINKQYMFSEKDYVYSPTFIEDNRISLFNTSFTVPSKIVFEINKRSLPVFLHGEMNDYLKEEIIKRSVIAYIKSIAYKSFSDPVWIPDTLKAKVEEWVKKFEQYWCNRSLVYDWEFDKTTQSYKCMVGLPKE